MIKVEPRSALTARPLLFAALAEAFDVRFGDTPQPAGKIVIGEAAAEENVGVPLLQLVHDRPAAGDRSPVEFAASSWLHPPLRGRALTDRFAAAAPPLRPGAREHVLAVGPGGPLWLRDSQTGAERASVAPEELPAGRRLRDLLRPDEFLPLLPLVSFLLRIAVDNGLRRPPLRAAILIDDPNLHRPSYGYINFERLAMLARSEGFHVAFATIPLDGWAVNRRAAACFADSDAPISLLVHGNDHLSGELARPVSDEHGLRQLGQALRRVRRFEERAGVPVARVMAPPHGRCSAETAARLARVGFEALCASRPLPWLDDAAPQPTLAGWRPAELVDGFPVIPRHHLAGDREEFVLRALLGQPLIAYGHHTDAADGYETFSSAARMIDSLGDVRWTNLTEICRSNVELRERDGAIVVRPFSPRTMFTLDRPALVTVELPGRQIEIELRTPQATFYGPGPHELQDEGPVELFTRRLDAVDPALLRPPARRAWPVARRALTESRDRLSPFLRRSARHGERP